MEAREMRVPGWRASASKTSSRGSPLAVQVPFWQLKLIQHVAPGISPRASRIARASTTDGIVSAAYMSTFPLANCLIRSRCQRFRAALSTGRGTSAPVKF